MERLPNNSAIHVPPGTAATFDLDAFDTLIQSQAVDFIHFRAMRCPIGVIDPFDDRAPHEHGGCSNGFIYTLAGRLMATFTGNSKDRRDQDVGWIDGSTAQITAKRFYEESDEAVQFAVFDRLYLNEENITVPTWELAEAHATGIEKLRFPVARVVDLVDANGHRYAPSDYVVETGKVRWLPGRGPGLDLDHGRGIVISVRYVYRPFWYVARLPHEIRVAQTETMLERRVDLINQAAVIVRENIFEKEQKLPATVGGPLPTDGRQERAPRDGIFGPR